MDKYIPRLINHHLAQWKVRCSLENFGTFDYIDSKAEGTVRHVKLIPLYAMSQLAK